MPSAARPVAPGFGSKSQLQTDVVNEPGGAEISRHQERDVLIFGRGWLQGQTVDDVEIVRPEAVLDQQGPACLGQLIIVALAVADGVRQLPQNLVQARRDAALFTGKV